MMMQPANETQQRHLETWGRHGEAEFVLRDPDAAIATMSATPYIYCAPLGQLFNGRDAVYEFYAQHFLPNIPSDVVMRPTSRLIADEYIWDEFIFSFTHDCEMPWKLPGIAPTGRHVEVVMNVVVQFEGDLMMYEHLMWDHASALTQVGVLNQPEAGHGVKATDLLLSVTG